MHTQSTDGNGMDLDYVVKAQAMDGECSQRKQSFSGAASTYTDSPLKPNRLQLGSPILRQARPLALLQQAMLLALSAHPRPKRPVRLVSFRNIAVAVLLLVLHQLFVSPFPKIALGLVAA